MCRLDSYTSTFVIKYNYVDTSLEAKMADLIDLIHYSRHRLDHLMPWRAAPKIQQLLPLPDSLVEYLIVA